MDKEDGQLDVPWCPWIPVCSRTARSSGSRYSLPSPGLMGQGFRRAPGDTPSLLWRGSEARAGLPGRQLTCCLLAAAGPGLLLGPARPCGLAFLPTWRMRARREKALPRGWHALSEDGSDRLLSTGGGREEALLSVPWSPGAARARQDWSPPLPGGARPPPRLSRPHGSGAGPGSLCSCPAPRALINGEIAANSRVLSGKGARPHRRDNSPYRVVPPQIAKGRLRQPPRGAAGGLLILMDLPKWR